MTSLILQKDCGLTILRGKQSGLLMRITANRRRFVIRADKS
jgi:hypothetical protein